MTTREFVDAALRPDPQYVSEKLEDHRLFTAAMCALVGLMGLALWGWDYVTDPVGARHTILLRNIIAMLMLALCVALLLGAKHGRLPHVAAIVLLAYEVLFTFILDRLNTGMTYGIGGYMYFFILPLLLLQGFPLRVNLSYLLAATLLPHLLALSRVVHGFEHVHYAVLIWPAAAMTAVAQFTAEHEYLQRYRLRRQLVESANTDALTGVSNRRHFMERAGDEVRRAKRQSGAMTCMMMDIDHFKKVNDEYGHPAGDKVIKAFAAVSKKQVRDIDLVGRLGGEEFAIMLVDTGLRNGRQVAERIRAAIEEEQVVDDTGRIIAFTVSIGITELQDDPDADAVLARADEALYRAKSKGRNRVCSKIIRVAHDTDDD